MFRFGSCFAALIALLSAISLTPFFKIFVASSVRFDAWLASMALSWLGQRTHSIGDTIISSRFAVSVLNECSASEFVTFLWAGLLAFPTTLRRKTAGLVLGTLLVILVNLARIVTLFLIGAHRPRFFTLAHEELWPGCFVIAIILFVAGWASWATGKDGTHADA